MFYLLYCGQRDTGLIINAKKVTNVNDGRVETISVMTSITGTATVANQFLELNYYFNKINFFF